MSLEGSLSFEDTVRIDGSFKGEITATGTLSIGNNTTARLKPISTSETNAVTSRHSSSATHPR